MYAILVDTTKCTACERCVDACVEANQLDPARAETDRYTSPDGLSANRLLDVAKIGEGRFARHSCMHCVEPSCVTACLVGGITKSPEGPVVYDPDKCIGCRYCMLACPFHVPRYEWDKTAPFMRKCDMCYERLQRGEQPACVKACPNGALIFGQRKDLLKRARATIAKAPNTYLSHIWGEKEFGGTSVLYISDVDLAKLGWPKSYQKTIASLTDPLITKTPFIGLGVGFGLIGINWIVRRRMELAAAKPQDKGIDNE
jgi:formate dehydrogenase iron-sulfur subunit